MIAPTLPRILGTRVLLPAVAGQSMSCAVPRAALAPAPGGFLALRVAVLAATTAGRTTTAPVQTGRDAADARAAAPPGPRIPHPAGPVEPADEAQAVMAIVRRAQAGEPEAFGELYDRYSAMVYRYIAYRCSNVSLAEDLTSETFLRALRRISSFTWQGRDFGAWLVTIARNLLADHYKSSRYKLEIATSDLVAAGADTTQDGPEDEVLTGITNAALLDAVRQLNSEQQECIAMRFLQGMSLAETALALGKNEGAIKALQYRAVKALGRLLPQELAA
jgi:RNA polymerase sigma-70 factor (ECF subfamily)